ncbi:MAG: hypothetical protein WAT58_01920 [Candidatus Dormiibacterota bacterium]
MEIQTRSIVGVFMSHDEVEHARRRLRATPILLLRSEVVESVSIGKHVLGTLMPQLEADYMLKQLEKGRTLFAIQVPAEDGMSAFRVMTDVAGSRETTALWGRSERVVRIVTSPV